MSLQKTESLVFNRTGRLLGKAFIFGNKKVDTVREYKYLGFLLTPSLSLKSSLADQKNRAMRAYYSPKAKLGQLFRNHITTTLHIFDSLIKPILHLIIGGSL